MIRRNFLKSVLALCAAPLAFLVPKKETTVDLFSREQAIETGRGYYYITEADLMWEFEGITEEQAAIRMRVDAAYDDAVAKNLERYIQYVNNNFIG